MSGESRLKMITVRYGVPGVAMFIGLSLADWFMWSGLIYAGVDIKHTAEKLGFDPQRPIWSKVETAGPLAAGYIIHKVILPVRLPITLGIIQLILRRR